MDSEADRGTPPEPDPYDLERFVRAQERDYLRALAELRSGRKRSHWMWYVFPQVRGLGFSAMSQRYAIASIDEAQAFLRHPVLGPRLRECANALLAIDSRSAKDILGSPDDLKLRSSATLFALVSPPGSAFEQVLQKYWQGEPDQATLRLLEGLG
jgi:uncharacterized protein (DUF1810 family)